MQLEVNSRFAATLAALGVNTPNDVLRLPGEIVSGHPDRHVVRVERPDFGPAFYLKRQHTVTLRERWRNWRAGFGWVSRCKREATLLQELAVRHLPCPAWVAYGHDGDRACLLVEELNNSTDLRQVLSDSDLSLHDRTAFADRLGRWIGEYHAAGFTTPDLTAKHVLVSADLGEVTLIDWQSARRVMVVSLKDRIRSLAVLHASLLDELATPRERLRVLRSALKTAQTRGLIHESFADIARRIIVEASRLQSRRSIRDQRRGVACEQRLVWVQDEAVCAIPEIAAIWPTPAIAAPFYDCEPGTLSVQLSDGRSAQLTRGRSFDPLGRLVSRFRGRPWRSPGVTHGRVLFHLERHGIPAPRLLAFGQRLIGATTAEWFSLHDEPVPLLTKLTHSTVEQLGLRLRQLHDAGCRPVGNPLTLFGQDEWGVSIRDVRSIRIVRRLSERDRTADLLSLTSAIEPALRESLQYGYRITDRKLQGLSPVGVYA